MGFLSLSEDELRDLYYIEEELNYRNTGELYKYLYPAEHIPLTASIFPATHKIFADAPAIYSRNNYPKHLEFWAKGKDYHQRLFRAGNRTGKTLAACLEVMYHTTGLYPEFWEGKRFTTNNDWWVVGVSQDTIIKILQPYFLGKVGDFGTGLIPRSTIDFDSMSDVKKANSPVGAFRIRHVNGTYSSIAFKSYEQGWETFQGDAVNVLLDEEPPVEVYREALMRTATGGSIMIITFTPLQGNSSMIQSWFPDGDVTAVGDVGNGRWVTAVGMDDVLHLDEKKITDLLAIYPPYQRTARRFGLPTLEEGAIYPIEESSFVIEPFEIPKHWPRAYGMDVGRHTAGVWIALDRDSGTLYTYSEMYIIEGLPSTHSEAVRARGKWLKGAIDTSARGRSPTDGVNLFQQYTDLGLNIQNADKAVESGIYEMLELLSSGRLKVFNTCISLLKEFRGYRRDGKGAIVKKNDHIMDAWRYGVFTRDRILQTEAEYDAKNKPQEIYESAYSHPDSWMRS